MPRRTIVLQTILFGHSFEHISRWCDSVDNAIRITKQNNLGFNIEVLMGDCSQSKCLDETQLSTLIKDNKNISELEYIFFGKNLGSAKGHNQLASMRSSEFFMTINPDTVLSPNCIAELIPLMEDESTGIGEAIQIPYEHPKEFDLETGDTSWASTCCALIRRKAFDEVKGFDSEHFFLHCDDVDFSWMVRLAGYRVRLAPRAVIFHHHGFGDDNTYVASSAEVRYSAIGSLMLFAKWGRKDLLESTLEHFNTHPDIYEIVLDDWNDHKKNGTIPETIPGAENVAQFIDGAFANHRWQ